MPDQRLKGQEVSIKVVSDGVLEAEVNTVATYNDTVKAQIKEQGYLGEVVNRFDDIHDGFGGDMEIHLTNAAWHFFEERVIARQQRRRPGLVFNVVRTDIFPNGSTAVKVYKDVAWGEMPSNVSARGDYVKVKLQFGCSERPLKVNALPT